MLPRAVGRAGCLQSPLSRLQAVRTIQRFWESCLEHGGAPLVALGALVRAARVCHGHYSYNELNGAAPAQIIGPDTQPMVPKYTLVIEEKDEDLAVRFAAAHGEFQNLSHE